MNSRSHAHRTPLVGHLGWLLAALALVSLGALWAWDRAQPRETPGWSDTEFVALQQAPGAPEGWDERWAVAVNLDCAACRRSLESLTAARDRSGASVRVSALIVDAPGPPQPAEVAALAADEAWWDRDQRWRRRWRHRVYGEVFAFGPGGELRRLRPPFEDVEAALAALEQHRPTPAP